METTNNKITIGCISPSTVMLFLIFFIAKIYNKIDWSWWWVFSPLWIPLAVILSILILGGIIWVLLILFDKKIW